MAQCKSVFCIKSNLVCVMAVQSFLFCQNTLHVSLVYFVERGGVNRETREDAKQVKFRVHVSVIDSESTPKTCLVHFRRD